MTDANRIAAETVDRDFAPTGKNQIDPAGNPGVWGGTLSYKQYRYVGYSDGKYSTLPCDSA